MIVTVFGPVACGKGVVQGMVCDMLHLPRAECRSIDLTLGWFSFLLRRMVFYADCVARYPSGFVICVDPECDMAMARACGMTDDEVRILEELWPIFFAKRPSKRISIRASPNQCMVRAFCDKDRWNVTPSLAKMTARACDSIKADICIQCACFADANDIDAMPVKSTLVAALCRPMP
jgi:hypothetical protein